jgi:diguanylate cyclase (GGDEF)-like protein
MTETPQTDNRAAQTERSGTHAGFTPATKVALLVALIALLTGAATLLFSTGGQLNMQGTILILLLATIFGLACYLLVRKLTAPLAQAASAAREIAATRLERPELVGSDHDVAGVEAVLQLAKAELDRSRALRTEDHQKLDLELKQRTSDLTQQNEELLESLREKAASEEQLRHLAYYDSLTSLPNRRLFNEQLEQLLRMAQRSGSQLAMLFLDLDDFKRINDSVGHRAGDILLQDVAARVQSCLRDSDLVAHHVDAGLSIGVSRIGGDEFTVVLNQLETAESAGVVAQRIVDALRQPFSIEGQEITVSLSIGIALAPGDASDASGLLKAADTAMYYAKAGGKNSYAYYQNHMDEPALARLRLEKDLRGAVERNELMLYYQPQVDTSTATVIGAEALLRWNHPEHGLVPPLQFIPIAEELNMIEELGKWTVQEACRQMNELITRGLKLPRVTVNVSALQFTPEFISATREALQQSGLGPGSLQLELTEGVAVKDMNESIHALNELKSLGVTLCIDDFGTTYSPLSYLSRFPLDEIKIDRRFLIKALESPTDANLVTAIIAIARNMQLNLVAEGVENKEQYNFLCKHGVQVIQGYLLSAPVSADELIPMLAPWHFLDSLRGLADGIEVGA